MDDTFYGNETILQLVRNIFRGKETHIISKEEIQMKDNTNFKYSRTTHSLTAFNKTFEM